MTVSPGTIPTSSPPSRLSQRISIFAADIKIQHSVFALPWALLSAVLAGKASSGHTPLTLGKVGLILVCMVTARTVAMAANRLLDAEMDAVNPRTARRSIPSGQLSRRFVWGMVVLCALGFIAACGGFELLYRNAWPLALCLPVLAFLCGYPFLKRFSRLCHYYLGAALAIAPVCAWVAVTGSIALPPFLMFCIVLTWTAGFDIIYACQDYENDVKHGVFSVPAKVGIARALWISRVTHAFSAILLIALWKAVPAFGGIYLTGACLAIGLLIVEQSLVRPGDLSKVNLSFFTINGIMSVMLGTLGIIDLLK